MINISIQNIYIYIYIYIIIIIIIISIISTIVYILARCKGVKGAMRYRHPRDLEGIKCYPLVLHVRSI